jgi:hypothetical protein
MTLEALTIANASLPTLSPSEAPDVLVMIDTICMPGAISRVTSQFTEPSTICKTRPFNILRALILIAETINQKTATGAIAIRKKSGRNFPVAPIGFPRGPLANQSFIKTLIASREKDSKARPEFPAAVVFFVNCHRVSSQRMELLLNRRFDKNVR